MCNGIEMGSMPVQGFGSLLLLQQPLLDFGPMVIMGAFWFCIPEDTDRNRMGPPNLMARSSVVELALDRGLT